MNCFYSKGQEAFSAEANAIQRLLTHLKSNPAHEIVLYPEKVASAKWLGDADLAELNAGASNLTIYTSGTTGAPKANRHSLKKLFEKSSRGEAGDAWLLCYSPLRWAGLSVIIHTVNCGARLLVPRSTNPDDLLVAIKEATHVSLTPSLFRKLLVAGPELLSRAPLLQLTFGGEWASQAVLDIARQMFPSARISHVYATTELGDVCAVSDGLCGYPVSKFRKFEIAPNGELFLEGLATGDLWEERDGRLFFLGRNTDQISVGGALVSATIVEETALEVSGVEQAQAYPMRNALLGHVVALRFTGSAEAPDIKRHLQARLPKAAVPMRFEKVEQIALNSNGKVIRQQVEGTISS